MDACKRILRDTFAEGVAHIFVFNRAYRRDGKVRFWFRAIHDASRAVCDISHFRNHPSFAAVIASPNFPPLPAPRHFTRDPEASDRRFFGDSSPCSLRHHPQRAPPSSALTFRPPPFSLAIPFLRCWTITLSRKAVAAITSAPKLLRHLGASLVLLRRNGNQRGGHVRRKAGEVKEKRRGKRDREEREAGEG